nr:MAG TPA: large terminase [Caudoviricetes sp.]
MASVAFVERILISSGNLFLVAGVSTDKAMRIVGQYIIDYFMSNYGYCGIAKKCRYNNSGAIKIVYKDVEKYILFAGGYNQNSQDFIQGSTFNGVYLTEINLLNTDFIQQCLQRIISFDDAFIYATLNPRSPKDPFYTEFLFRWYREQESNPDKEWLNYNKFYLEDNPILTPEMIEDAKMGYDPESLRYKRDILCQRVDAEGSIYRLNNDNIINEITLNPKKYIIVADFGETISATYFGCYTEYYNKDLKQYEVHLVKEYHHLNKDNNLANFKYSDDYCDDLIEFVKDCGDLFNSNPYYLFYDGTTEIYYKIRKRLDKNNLPISMKTVIKDENDERISMVQNALYKRKLRIYKECSISIQDIRDAVYDSKAYESTGKFKRLENFNDLGHSDSLDALEYSLSYYKTDLNLRC